MKRRDIRRRLPKRITQEGDEMGGNGEPVKPRQNAQIIGGETSEEKYDRMQKEKH